MAEGRGAAWRRRLHHFGRHPIAWGRYLYERELRHRDVLFGVNPRFRDWRPMYRVARPALGRLTGRPLPELDGYFAEIGPLHAELSGSVAGLPSAGAMMQAPLLYVFVRAVRPERMVETGVSSGYSARLVLEAMERNGTGRLWSIGIPRLAVGPMAAGDAARVADRPIGWLVPERLRGRWELRIGKAEEMLGAVLEKEAVPLDVFVHDSLHLYEHMLSEYAAALPQLRRGGYLLSHDIHNNPAWPEFLARERLPGDEELDHDLGAVRVPG
jgi:hypothetical protein